MKHLQACAILVSYFLETIGADISFPCKPVSIARTMEFLNLNPKAKKKNELFIKTVCLQKVIEVERDRSLLVAFEYNQDATLIQFLELVAHFQSRAVCKPFTFPSPWDSNMIFHSSCKFKKFVRNR